MKELEITPGDNLLVELGQNSLTPEENIAEPINNGIQSAANANLEETDVTIEISHSFKNKSLNSLVIEDGSAGMSFEELESGLRPGQTPKIKNGLSEHGMGLNHFIAGVGGADGFDHLITKKIGSEKAIMISDYAISPKKIKVSEIDWNRPHGTYIKLKLNKLNFANDAGNFAKQIKKMKMFFGAKYKYYLTLKEEDSFGVYRPKIVSKTQTKLNLFIKVNNLDTNESTTEIISPIFPEYSHPETKENKPKIELIRFASGLEPGEKNRKDKDGNEIIPKWEVYFCGGPAPRAEDLPKGSIWCHPYGVKPGIDIYINGVLVIPRALKELGIDLQKEGNSWGKLRGELHLSLPGKPCVFKTTSAKNGIIVDDNFIELSNMLQKYLKDQNLYQSPARNNKEYEVCDKIYKFFEDLIGMPGNTIKEIIKGYRPDDPGFPKDLTLVCFTEKPDVYKKHVYEVKLESIGQQEALQPFGYIITDNSYEKKGFIVGKSLAPAGAKTIEGLKESSPGYEIEFIPLSRYGIIDE
jgi:hypothetical protein